MWLNRLQKLDNEINVGIIGAGSMGRGLVHQCAITPGMNCVVVADIKIEKAISAAELIGRPVIITKSTSEIEEAVRRGYTAVTDNGHLVANCESVAVLVESTSSIVEGALFSERALRTGKDLVLMNSEIDLAFGPHFLSLANEYDVVYTSCDGDQHGVIKRLYDEMTLWGMEPVMAGNIKGYLDHYSNPTEIIPEADKRRLDYRMATAYTDGSKLAIEMALVANALDFEPSITGMAGPRANHVSEVFNVFDFAELKRRDRPIVDYVLGAEPGGGVFCIGYCENTYQQDMLSYYKMGDGPFYLFYRPYHLCHVEAMQSIAEAYLDRVSLLQPTYGFQTNVHTFAKKDLKAGEIIDGLGGYTVYGLLEEVNEKTIQSELPICISEGAKLKRDISIDERIGMEDVIFQAENAALTMYKQAVAASCSKPVNIQIK